MEAREGSLRKWNINKGVARTASCARRTQNHPAATLVCGVEEGRNRRTRNNDGISLVRPADGEPEASNMLNTDRTMHIVNGQIEKRVHLQNALEISRKPA